MIIGTTDLISTPNKQYSVIDYHNDLSVGRKCLLSKAQATTQKSEKFFE